jgi:hypothetical protein
MEKQKIEEYLPGVEQISGVELDEQDKQALTALLGERHFKHVDPTLDGLSTFLKVLRLIEVNSWPLNPNSIIQSKEQLILRKRPTSYFPKALKKSEKGKRQNLTDCTGGFVRYLNAQGLGDNDSWHLAGRIIAVVYSDWYPRYKNGTTKGLGGERNFILRRIKHLLGEVI